jgi:hypothetical protein
MLARHAEIKPLVPYKRTARVSNYLGLRSEDITEDRGALQLLVLRE